MGRRRSGLQDIVRAFGEAEKTRRVELRIRHAKEREQARRRAQAERREERAKRERRRQEEEAEADAEFEAWEAEEEALEQVAAPVNRPGSARTRLRELARPAEFEAEPFDEHPFDYRRPTGPSARLVLEARDRADQAFVHPRFVPDARLRWVRPAGTVAALLAAVALAAVIAARAALPALGWLLALPVGAALAFWAAVEASERRRWNDHAEARAAALAARHEAAAQEVAPRYQAAELERWRSFDAAQARARAAHHAAELARTADAREALRGEPWAMDALLDTMLSLDDAPVPAELAATVRDEATVDVVLTAPAIDALPSRKARRVKAGVSYRDRNERELTELYRRVVPGLALRAAAEVFALLPTVQTVNLDVVEARISPSTGQEEGACVVALQVERAELEELDLAAVEPEAAVEGLGGAIGWSRGQYVVQESVTGADEAELEDADDAADDDEVDEDADEDAVETSAAAQGAAEPIPEGGGTGAEPPASLGPEAQLPSPLARGYAGLADGEPEPAALGWMAWGGMAVLGLAGALALFAPRVAAPPEQAVAERPLAPPPPSPVAPATPAGVEEPPALANLFPGIEGGAPRLLGSDMVDTNYRPPGRDAFLQVRVDVLLLERASGRYRKGAAFARQSIAGRVFGYSVDEDADGRFEAQWTDARCDGQFVHASLPPTSSLEFRVPGCAYGWKAPEGERPPPPPGPPAPPVAPPAPLTALVAGIQASSTMAASAGYRFDAAQLVDGDPATCWQPARSTSGGVGAWIKVELTRSAEITGVELVNGYQVHDQHGDEFLLNSRVRRLTLTCSDGFKASAEVDPDARQVQRIAFGPRTCAWLRLDVDAVRPGQRWPDLAIGELVLHGRP